MPCQGEETLENEVLQQTHLHTKVRLVGRGVCVKTGCDMEGEDANTLQILSPLPESALNPAPSLSSCICPKPGFSIKGLSCGRGDMQGVISGE